MATQKSKQRKTVSPKGNATYSVSTPKDLLDAIDIHIKKLAEKDGIKRTRSSYFNALAIKDTGFAPKK